MRNAILRMPDERSSSELRQVLRTAIRQLERADIYLAAVCAIDLGDPAAQRAVEDLRNDTRQILRHLSDDRARLSY